MSRFVTTKDGWVNLDHVAKISINAVGDSLLYGVDGEVLGAAAPDAFDQSVLGHTTIPAAPGERALVITPTDADPIIEEFQIIGWRLPERCDEFSFAEPILPYDANSDTIDQTVLIRLPGGRVMVACGDSYDSLEEFLQTKCLV